MKSNNLVSKVYWTKANILREWLWEIINYPISHIDHSNLVNDKIIKFQRYSTFPHFFFSGQLNRYYNISKQTNVLFFFFFSWKHAIKKKSGYRPTQQLDISFYYLCWILFLLWQKALMQKILNISAVITWTPL